MGRSFGLVATLIGIQADGRARADPPATGLVDGNFEQWKDEMPAAWRVEDGAIQQGGGEPSKVERASGGGIALAGAPTTRTWKMIAQTVAVEPGHSYWLRFEARALGSKHEDGQPGSVYIGVVDRDASGIKMASLRAETTFRETWTPGSAVFRAAGARADVVAFHARSGRLELRDVRWEEITPDRAYDVLLAEFDRHYSFFAERGRDADWPVPPRETDEDRKSREGLPLEEWAIRLLRPFDDPHVTVRGTTDTGLAWTAPTADPVALDFDAKSTAKRLSSVRQIVRNAFVGVVAPDVGYVAVGALPQPPAEADRLVAAIESLLDKKALIVDLRPCQGGFEPTAQRIVAMLAEERRVYARRRFRNGPGHDAFGPWIDSEIAPREGKRFDGPVVAILGPGCVSSGEGMAAMLAVLPKVTTIGKPTRGASGNPQPVDLPNGVSVWFSRWQSALPDGTLLEKHGVVPQIAVNETGPDDPTLTKALEIAKQKIAERDAKDAAKPPK